MKKVSFLLLILYCFTSQSQRILYVDNTPSRPAGAHVYSSLQTAINESQPGDIIHVKPSANSYGNITINASRDSITIYGIGFNPQKEISLLSRIGQLNISGYNIKMSGLSIENVVYIADASISGNLSFENNMFNSQVIVPFFYAISNVIFRNNIFYGLITSSATLANNIVYNNCIFSYNSTNAQINAYNGTLFSNCLFYGASSGNTIRAFVDASNVTVSNCIFWGRGPTASSNMSNVSFNNCLVKDAAENFFPTSPGNSINNCFTELAVPIFHGSNIVLQLIWNRTWNPILNPEATALFNAGNEGTDIGLTGGTIPYKHTGAPLPYIKSMIVPSVIRRGDNMQISIEATGN